MAKRKQKEIIEEQVISVPEEVDQEPSFQNPQKFKKIYTSKTFWVNTVAFIAFLIQQRYGYAIDEGMQVQIVSVINIILRSISSDGVRW